MKVKAVFNRVKFFSRVILPFFLVTKHERLRIIL